MRHPSHAEQEWRAVRLAGMESRAASLPSDELRAMLRDLPADDVDAGSVLRRELALRAARVAS